MPSAAPPGPADAPASALARVRDGLARVAGRPATGYKDSVLARRIAVRQRALGTSALDAYLRHCEREPAEWQRLADALTIHVTAFRRDADVWDALDDEVRRTLAPSGRPVQAWSAGCANGAEAWTLAMLLAEACTPERVAVVATDVDPASVAAAERATYTEAALRPLPAASRARWLEPAGAATWRVGDALATRVAARRHDLLADAPPVRDADVVTCRNVLIYLDADAQHGVLARCHDALRPGGLLLLGAVEHVPPSLAGAFEPVRRRQRLYRRRA